MLLMVWLTPNRWEERTGRMKQASMISVVKVPGIDGGTITAVVIVDDDEQEACEERSPV
jgi:hypothetical protein